MPKATSQVVLASIATAIEQGLVWYRDGDISLWQESVPDGVLRSDGRLFAAPSAIDPQQLTIKQLPDAWDIDRTTLARLVEQLKTRDNIPYPWPLIRHAINAAIQVNLIRVAPDSQPWTGSILDANGVVFTPVATAVIQQGLLGGMPAVTASAPLSADGTLTINELQDLSEVIPSLNSAAASLEGNLSIAIRLTVNSTTRSFSTADALKLNEALGSVSRKLPFKR